ncbi:D-2-hydroxyacid dehydrogenase, partial [Lacticaseibacillus paracasei subsp. paracasei Lpp48]
VVIQQHGAIPDEMVYQKLKVFGIKQLTFRITGYDIVNLGAATANGLVVTNVPAYSPRSVSELVLAQVMRLIRHLGEASAREAKDDYSWTGLEAPEIHNLTVGIIGAGKIGSAVARIFRALGATVIVSDPVKRPELADTVSYVDLNTLLTTSDVVTVHTPLDGVTTHLIDADALRKMKPTAYLINAARGPIVDTEALIKALNDHTIAGAALDTIEGEAGIFGEDRSQTLVDNQALETLKALPNVEISPHIGFYTDAAVKNMIDISLDDVKTILEGGKSAHQVN